MKKNKLLGVTQSFSRYEFKYILSKNIADKIENEIKHFMVLDENEGKDVLPTIEIECEKCGNNQAVWWMLQTRSADEPTTQFYRCTKCSYTWRNYA